LTFFNIGWRNDFVIRWWPAFAAGAANLAVPFARSLTQRIVVAIDRRRFRSEGPGLGRFVAEAGDASIQPHERAVDRIILASAVPTLRWMNSPPSVQTPESEWNSERLCTSPFGMNSCIM
jgi:hypothetical protein